MPYGIKRPGIKHASLITWLDINHLTICSTKVAHRQCYLHWCLYCCDNTMSLPHETSCIKVENRFTKASTIDILKLL